jgi:peptidoglycan glycosyltransferase
VNGPIRRLAIGIYAAFMALLLGVTWVQVIRADELKLDARNPRPALTLRGKERGIMVTVDGTVVARSVQEENSRDFLREYPEGPTFAHVVGYSSYLVGQSGLEASYSQQLRSRRDLTISDIIAVIFGADLAPRNLELTLDARIQRAAAEALGDLTGAVVVMDPKTGAVLASYSNPSFDPALLAGDEASTNWERLLADPNRPLNDRATRELYAPGSTFKVVVAAAAIDTEVAAASTLFADPLAFQLPGSTATISNFDGRACGDGNTVRLDRAFIRSCNTVFADLAIQVGAPTIGLTADGMGWNRVLDFPWQIPAAVFRTEDLSLDAAALGQSGIGERDVRATPLHMAMVAATVANDGVTPNPHLVRRVFDAEGNTVEETEPTMFGRAMESTTAATLKDLMVQVVTNGTGRRAAVTGVQVAGKTGTATGARGFSNAWFIGFAPADDPQIAFAVLVEGNEKTGEDLTGGTLAAPIAARIVEAWRAIND